MARLTPPEDNQLEVSVFGPGIGECVVCHLTGGRWVVVDSCLDHQTKQPVALRYFNDIGVDPSAIALVVASHWHDDHVSGLSRVVEAAHSAKFACSAALRAAEFFALIETSRRFASIRFSSGVDEMRHILDRIQARPDRNARLSGPDYWASEGSALLLSQAGEFPVAVHALSPTAAVVTRQHHALAKYIPGADEIVQRVPSLSANELSVALWLSVGPVCVLLGADLERGSAARPPTGWEAVVASEVRPSGKARVFKVAHHGSDNAHCEAVWTDLVHPSPHSVLAPFFSGRRFRPAPEDVSRLKKLTPELYCTKPIRGAVPPRRSQAVERMVATRTLGERRVAVDRRPGHVRYREQIGTTGAATVDLFDGAVRL